MDLRFRLLNVFAIEGDPFSGNPLCVFEEAPDLSTEQMQAWARQFNLSETSFVTSMDRPDRSAAVRIFTASYEMPFAGHPTLGTAHVVAERLGGGGEPVDAVALTMPAGRIPVRRSAAGWQLRAKSATCRASRLDDGLLAEVLGIGPGEVVESVLVDAGVEQLIVQLDSVRTVRSCTPNALLMTEHLTAPDRPPHAYVWAWTGEGTIEARLFAVSGTALEEDPATGSACSNLGGWLVHEGRRAVEVVVSQGAQVSRPSRLVLTIDEEGTVFVAGQVHEVGEGRVRLGGD